MQETVVAVCMSKGCRKKGSPAVHAKLAKQLAKHGLESCVLLARAGCLGQCGKGAALCLQPEGRLFTGVEPGDVKRLVRIHLRRDRPRKGSDRRLRSQPVPAKTARRLAKGLRAA